MKLNLPHLRQGMASLTLVLIVVTLISLIMLPIFLITYIRNTQAVRFYHSQQAFFAAEGAYAETVGRIKSHPGWITDDGSPYEHNYTIPPNTIQRTITNSSGTYFIEITADNRLAQRKIEGVFTPAGATTTTVDNDVMFLLDYSSSMDPIIDLPALKNATKDILATLGNNPQNRVGIVIYATTTAMEPLQSLNQLNADPYVPSNDLELQALYDFIDNTNTPSGVNVGAFTNTGEAIREAIDEMNANFDSTKNRFIVLFSDGAPNRPLSPCAYNHTFTPILALPPYEPFHYDPTETYLIHYGNPCTDYAITTARSGRDTTNASTNNIQIYTVLLTNFSPTTWGQNILFSISSDDDDSVNNRYLFDPGNLSLYQYYKETADSSELSTIFTSIVDTISTGGSASYGEAVPD